MRKVREALAGHRVEFNGEWFTPLYTPKNPELMSRLQVTASEERQLQTIITKDEKRRRDRVSTMEARRAAGVVERETWLQPAIEREKIILRRAAEGWKQKDIAAELGITPARVSQVLAKNRSRGD